MTETKTMRTVTVFERKWNGKTYDLIETVKGAFHGWGLDVEEGESGVASFSIAIVELSDGTVLTPQASLIKFNNEEK